LAQTQTRQQRRDEALRLYRLGLQQYRQGYVREALARFEQALVISKEIGERKFEGSILNNIGGVYEDREQYAVALEYYQQALATVKQIDDKVLEGVTLNNIGLVYLKLGQYTVAIENFQQALAIVKQIGNRAAERTMLMFIGNVYHNIGQYTVALEYYQQALAIAKQIGDRMGEGTTLNNIGEVYRNIGQYTVALEYYQQALAIAKQIGDRMGESVALNNIGLVYRPLGRYSKALEYYQQALAIRKQLGDKGEEGITLSNIGTVYNYLGQYSKALEYYQKALVIHRQIKNKAAETTELNNLGLAYFKLGEVPKALGNFQQALAISTKIGGKTGESIALSGIGSVYSYLGQYSKALDYYQKALVIHRQIKNKAGETTELNNLGSAYFKLGQYPKALEKFQQALAISKQIGYKAVEATTLNDIGFVYNAQGKYSQAETTLLAAIEIWESLRHRELKDDQKISIFETQAGSYRFLQTALVAQNKNNEALEIAERSRGRAFVELLASKLSENTNNQLNIKPKIQKIQQIAKEQNATLVQYSIIYDRFTIQGKEEWQQKLLYIWVIKPTGEVTFKQVDLKSINRSLADLVTSSRGDIGVKDRSIFEVTPTNPQPQNSTEKLQQLHKILIAPIADLLPKDPNERVIFIPQESLFVVPFAALQDEQGKYLIEKHTILTAPAIQVLDLTRKQKQNTQRSAKDVLVVGNPTMPKIKIGELVAKLDPLSGAEKEAIQIAKFFNTEALTGSKATKTAVMQLMQKARIIHLATHGLLHDFKGFGVPGAIALAPSGKPDDGIDGLLTAGEIFDMKLQADLVVLSACDTGRGDITGDGVVGLSRSLISAGVPSVMVSLWAVNDNSTAFLMTEFYRNLQQNPDKAVALRQAMLTAMKQYPNPKQWAAFTLIGESE
ncbi:MAG: CHAT domain-containing tetratricopeptide repeat protein, partial [Cyanobacteriota bacterium]